MAAGTIRRYQHLNLSGRERLGGLWRLLRALVVRQLKGRYRRSILGPAWAVLQPLIYIAVLTVLRRILAGGEVGIGQDAVETACLVVPWTLFSNGVSRATPSVYANASLVKKMAVDREIFPLAAAAACLVDFALASLILGGMICWAGLPVTAHYLWLPLLAGLLWLTALGVSFFTAAFGTFKQDVQFAVPFLLQLWLLLSGVVFSIEQVPEAWRWLYRLNPLAGLMEGFRSVLAAGAAPDGSLLGWSVLSLAVIWLVSWPLFRRLSQYFADVL